MMNRVVTERYSVVLNIGLNNNPLAHTPLPQAAEFIRNAIVTYQGIITAGYEVNKDHAVLVDKGLSTEPTLIVSFDVFSTKGPDGIRYHIEVLCRKLAALLGQEAIAYRMYDTAEGASQRPIQGFAGPAADQWGAFDPAKFIGFTSVSSIAVKFGSRTGQLARAA